MEMAKLLIAHGADVNAGTGDTKTALSLVLEKGGREMVTFLREHGCARVSLSDLFWCILYDDESLRGQRP